MKPFINDDFMLDSSAARELYHGNAEHLPIIDYHCHLNPQEIAQDKRFSDISELWLSGDHYKWRALRANGIEEKYVTGDAPAWDKFEKWAETVPYTMRNPLYHWTHIELMRAFGIDKLLSPATAREIFEECNAKLAEPEFSAKGLIRKFNVETICTTDDPADDLCWHKQIAEEPFGTKVLPTWRPDKSIMIEKPAAFKEYVAKLGEAADMDIHSYADLMDALRKRHHYFESLGCKLSDHGLDTFHAADYTDAEIESIFAKVLAGKAPDSEELEKFRSAGLHDLAVMDAESGWAQQFHMGVIRNNRSSLMRSFGPDAGTDSILDLQCAEAGNRFFDKLDSEGKLAKTILYCLNPKDVETVITMAYNFNDGSIPGKMQYGSGWWFLDQEDGMRKQMNALSVLGLLPRFVGMLTDSRSFVSYTRHEYFRRILCSVVGMDVEKGKLPASEMEFIGKMIQDISYYNAKNYFNF
ncbi:MAG: glucuronate isomerase [Bacteroidales bacterium]|nr:glucuronate isomerase [Candidatus Cryptobacteroides caccocaballi]